ncbi:phosphotransferase enzyme family protein [Catenuloplanes indicus]|uniref:Ser/Thr protein kinase RdoA (MazF antagonist) n=1 Tax=Catenuloplanes indicus TaxID=137267 RepID=A0AAE3VU75_9ACTN|nr:phosphotransferase [Catenuloplanes indicus]MDQ0363744.1 Ser/Thr protein kinase RdoA (MazF antagonist) [Catenuloplanes indicus]
MVDPVVGARWRITAGPPLGDRPRGTWAAARDGVPLVVKFFDEATFPDWRYTVRVADALRARGWPTPELADDTIDVPGGAWALFHRLPGRPRDAGPGEQRARGRLLAGLHESAAATGITGQRGGFADPAAVVADPTVDDWLRIHERTDPDGARTMWRHLDATRAWFAAHPAPDVPRSVIHGDFAPWNLLYDDGRLTGVLDFEGTHHTVQVADFALSWRGYQDEVLRGYDEVRPLSEVEWQLIRPAFRAWLFIDARAELAALRGGRAAALTDLSWPLAHLRKRSPLLDRRAGPGGP